MARTVRTVTDTADLTPVQRGQRVGRPTERRTGTRAAVIRAELESYGYAVPTALLSTVDV